MSQAKGLKPEARLSPGEKGHSLEVICSRFDSRKGLIGHGPHHDRRVIFVPAHQLLHHLKVVPKRLVAKTLAVERERKGSPEALRQAGEAGQCRRRRGGHSREHDAHTGTLINDHNSISVTELKYLLRVGIVAGTKGIGPEPSE